MAGQEHGNHSCEDGWLLLWREAGSEKVYDQIATGKKQIYTYGPIIHNEEVVQDLEEKGVQVINSKEELEAERRRGRHPFPRRRQGDLRTPGTPGTGACGRDLSICQKDPQDCPGTVRSRTPRDYRGK